VRVIVIAAAMLSFVAAAQANRCDNMQGLGQQRSLHHPLLDQAVIPRGTMAPYFSATDTDVAPNGD
jgi:hypothetical protein